jgi:hypothetical protein
MMRDNKYILNFGARILLLMDTWDVKKHRMIFRRKYMPPFSGKKQLNIVPASTSCFCTVHLNMKFPSKPKYLRTFFEKTVNFFGERSWGEIFIRNYIPPQQIVVVLSAKKGTTGVLLGNEVANKTTEGISKFLIQQ